MPLNPARLRTMVDGWLNDTCTVNAPGVVAYDPDLGYDTAAAGGEVYSGKCRIRPSGGSRVVMAGDAPVTLRLFDLTLPWDATALLVDQLVTVTDSNDPYMVDRVFRVVDVLGGSDTAYRRAVVEDTLAPDESETA